MCDNCNRREFLGAATVSGLMMAGQGIQGASGNEPATTLPSKVRICAMFCGPPGPADRAWCVSEQEQAAMQDCLKKIETKLGNVEFVTGQVTNAEQASQLLKKAGDEAPVLAVNMGIGRLLRAAPPVLEAERPMAVFSAPASGHDWMYPYRWRKEGKPATRATCPTTCSTAVAPSSW